MSAPNDDAAFLRIVSRFGVDDCLAQAQDHDADARRYSADPFFSRFPTLAETSAAVAEKLRRAVKGSAVLR